MFDLGDAHLKVASAEVSDVAYISEHTVGEVHFLGVDLHVDEYVPSAGVDFDAGKVLEAPECEIVS